MAAALLRDLADERVVLMRDARLGKPACGDRHEVLFIENMNVWPRLLGEAEAVWLIAPESGGILAHYSEQVLQAGKLLFGSLPDTIAVCGDKLQTVKALQAKGVPCVPSWSRAEFRNQVPPPWIIKPVDGVGCEGVVKVERLPGDEGNWIIQPYVPGEPLSLSAVFLQGEAVCICVNRQRIVPADGGFQLLGCQVNVAKPCGPWQRLCERIAATFPGLWGYAGIDVILTDQGPLVVEINPRLTLSYAGLSAAFGDSLAARIVALARGSQSLSGLRCWRRKLGRGRTVWVAA